MNLYPDLKKGLEDVFNMKCSLEDLAKELEKDLVIYEHYPKKFKVVMKRSMMLTKGLMRGCSEAIIEYQTDNDKME